MHTYKDIIKNDLKQEMQCTYKHNIEACSSNRCSHRKAIRITYSECVPVALVTQDAKCMHRYYTAICRLSSSNRLLRIISQTAQLLGKSY